MLKEKREREQMAIKAFEEEQKKKQGL